MAAARALNVGQPREMRMFPEKKGFNDLRDEEILTLLKVFRFDNVK
jgi:hypothetical protein